MLKPNAVKKRVTEITPQLLKDIGADALLLDVDNTLSTHHGTELLEGLPQWIDDMKAAGVPLLLLSNSKEKRVKPFAKKIGLPYISLGLKPLPNGFFKAAKRLKMKKRRLALAGDQIFTDVLGAKLAGVKVILLEPILPETKWSFKVRRLLEKGLRKKYKTCRKVLK